MFLDFKDGDLAFPRRFALRNFLNLSCLYEERLAMVRCLDRTF